MYQSGQVNDDGTGEAYGDTKMQNISDKTFKKRGHLEEIGA
jgi:hypothetical protein